MVYCGKPSKACEPCRSRRIKCDLRRPECSQCTKISRPCPGYRNQLDLRFRDESASVIHKLKRKQKTHGVLLTDSSSDSSASSSQGLSLCSEHDVLTFPQPEQIANHLPLILSTWTSKFQVEDLAEDHFMSTYVLGSHFDYLSTLMKNTFQSSPLHLIIKANACANFYRETGQSIMLEKGQNYYAQALTSTRSATQSPATATQDSTVASILLLSLYDTLTQEYRKCPESFAAHLNGAAALLSMRGAELFETWLGRRIFLHVALNLRVSCALNETELPPGFRELDAMAAPFLTAFTHVTGFHTILDAFSSLQAKAKQEHESGILTTETVQIALEYDQAIVKLLEEYSHEFECFDVHIDHDDPHVLGRTYQQFPNHRVAQRWNAMRMLRMLFNEHVWETLTTISNQSTSSQGSIYLIQELSRRTAAQMARDICASIPQFCKHGSNGLLPVTSALFLLWPLAMAGQCQLSSHEVKDYAVRTLRFLGEEARLPQGVWAAEMLSEGRHVDDWLHLSHIA